MSASKKKCCVLTCCEKSGRFFRFPRVGSKKYNEWLSNCQFSSKHIAKLRCPFICEKHFESKYFGKNKLFPEAIPTLLLEENKELCTFSVKTDDETLDTMLSSTSSEQKIVCTNSSSTQTDNAAGSQINHSTEVDLYMQCAAQQLKTFPELDAWAIIVNIQQTINEKRLEIMNRPNKRTLISATISSSRSQTPTLPYDST
ncbi:uncharacterized protein LOC119668470 isoform X1 [Teleopsis dalmanni]|uniref:uncharacterized protein LOC119668470 isoform X1 n=1 Tax=Teleopsis dalmanni TaxID=139649 RepID=UPI0018CDF8DA|nr:uncharacterized protein LOC119668470 isoform X1 [Teleopsis dalmanni]